mmetsp:Transcript_38518/g.101620  ORF Transcript_38518/g.101620 Transcript_38518/m.101620 type:complete len:286 (+) Transcript_38518:562-1419(+)
MPELSAKRSLWFCGSSRLKHVVSMGTQCVVNNDAGQLVVDKGGHFVSARLPVSERLPAPALQQLDELLTAWARRGRYTRRGDCHAAVCTDFVMGGLKGDQDTCMAMPPSHVADTAQTQLAYMNIMNRMRAFLQQHILPRVEKYFFSLIDSKRELMHAAGLRFSFVDYFTSVSLGDAFVPRAHIDSDLWVTVLVATGTCTVGGEFAHPEHGVAHKIHAGDILVVNPAMSRCTAVMSDPDASRRMIALFVSDNALKACLTSMEVATAEGLHAYTPAQIHARQRKRKR